MGAMDWSIVHALNSFLAHHDGIEDPALLYERASEALFLAMLVVAFVVVPGRARRGVQRAVVAAGLSDDDIDRLIKQAQREVEPRAR